MEFNLTLYFILYLIIFPLFHQQTINLTRGKIKKYVNILMVEETQQNATKFPL